MTKLTAYRISNRTSGNVLGIFLAKDHDAALDACAVRAGYKNHSDIPGADDGHADIDVVNVDSDINFVVDHVIDGIEKNREYNDGYYSSWDDGRQAREIYCDFSSWIDELGANERRIKDILVEESDAADIIDDRISAWLDEAKTHERAGIVDDVKYAENLDALRTALNAADKFAAQSNEARESIYDSTSLRTYGGSKPKDGATYPVFSFDEENVLVIGAGAWEILSRAAHATIA